MAEDMICDRCGTRLIVDQGGLQGVTLKTREKVAGPVVAIVVVIAVLAFAINPESGEIGMAASGVAVVVGLVIYLPVAVGLFFGALRQPRCSRCGGDVLVPTDSPRGREWMEKQG